MAHIDPYSEQFKTSEQAEYAFLASAMLDLEKAMRKTGYWSEVPPHTTAFQSTIPFFCDTMNLDAWLQWVFIPRMKAMIEHEAPLPQASIYEYAEETLGKLDNTDEIMGVIKRLDVILSGD